MRVVRGTPKHLSKTGQLDSFTYLMLSLERSCNYKCLKCFKRGRNIAGNAPQDLLTLNQRIDTIHQAHNLGGKVVVFPGEGEPSLHPTIENLILETSSLNMTSIVYSNGSKLDLPKIEFYRSNNAVLVIAVDSLNPTKYRYLTDSPVSLEYVLHNIANVRQTYASTITQSADLKVVNLAINMTVSSINVDEIPQIKRFCGDDIYFVCNPLDRSGAAAENWDALMLGVQNPNEYANLIKGYSESGGPLTLGSNGCCGYSFNGIGISPTGEFMSCAYTDKTNGLLGNIKSSTLEEGYLRKHLWELEHLEQFGAPTCLVRHQPFFDQSVRRLKQH